MKKSLFLSYVVRWLNTRTLKTDRATRRLGKYAGLFCLAMGLFLMSMFFSACSNPFGGGGKTVSSVTPTVSTQQVLNTISWCAKPLMVFRDEGAATPTATATSTSSTPTATATSTSGTPAAGPGTPSTVTSWSVVKSRLGFTVYLPASLPHGSCLVSAQATIHDSIYGGQGSFTIGYLLPDHTSLSISETPLIKSLDTTFQCNPNSPATPTSNSTPTTTPTVSPTLSQLCSGAKNTTNIVIAGPGNVAHLQQIFTGLVPDITWIPAS
ncbi:MAG: hypothetical protein ABI234_05170 [Ktedonobacteraceae bacterium]